MKKIFVFLILILSILMFLSGCGNKDYSGYKNEKGYSDYISNRNTGCKHMNSFGLKSNLNKEDAQEYYKNNVRRCGDFLITNYMDGICVNKYIGNSSVVNIPNYLNGKPVIMLGQDLDNEFFSTYDIHLKIPANIRYISSNIFNYYDEDGNIFNIYESIEVDMNNPYYYSYNNSIYTKDRKTLLYFNYSHGPDDSKNGIMLSSVENFEPINPLENQPYVIVFSDKVKYVDASIDLGEWKKSPSLNANITVMAQCSKDSAAYNWANKHRLRCVMYN